jgi:hypothetical protein
MIGRDSHGNWVVRDQGGMRGGIFIDQLGALRYVRSENANRTQAYIAINGVLELDMSRTADALAGQQLHSSKMRRIYKAA